MPSGLTLNRVFQENGTACAFRGFRAVFEILGAWRRKQKCPNGAHQGPAWRTVSMLMNILKGRAGNDWNPTAA